MDTFWEALLELLPFAQLFENWGLSKELSSGLSVVVIAFIGIIFTKLYNYLRDRYKLSKAARDLYPYFDYAEVKRHRKWFIPTRFQPDPETFSEQPESRQDIEEENPKPLIPYFINIAFNEKKGNDRYFLILAGSGMGKTTFLINLYMKYISFFNFRQKYIVRLFRFGYPDFTREIKHLAAQEDAKNTILLLDAFDEHIGLLPPEKHDGITDEDRFLNQFDEIIRITKSFRRVVITVRIQYFPGYNGTSFKLKIPHSKGFHNLVEMHISPFSPKQTSQFLNKKYGLIKFWNFGRKKKALSIIDKCSDLMARPMLLNHIDLFVDNPRTFQNSYDVFEILVERWIENEANKPRFSIVRDIKENLLIFSKLIALEIYKRRKENNVLHLDKTRVIQIAKDNHLNLKNYEITGESLLVKDASENWKFSHKSILEYFIAKSVLENPSFEEEVVWVGFYGAKHFYNEVKNRTVMTKSVPFKYGRENMPDPSYRFADIHCHPHIRSYNRLHKPWNPSISKQYHPWWIILPELKISASGIRVTNYSQCDLVQVINANVKLAIVSLYPLEKGWVTGPKNIDQRGIYSNAMFGNIGNDDIKKQEFLYNIFPKLPPEKIKFYQSEQYDYFTELRSQHEYLIKKNGIESQSELFVRATKKVMINPHKLKKKCPVELDATGTYVFAKNGKHAKEIIDEGKTAFIMSIEGANIFNSHEPIEEVKKKIMEVKGWEESLFFITFTHHFNNHLAGHAHSIPDIGTNLINQDEGVNAGFTDDGREVLRLLLSIDKNNNKVNKNGRRVLIDVKHLSVVARREFYDEIVEPCMKKGDIIPVIASHVAYSGVEKIQTLVNNLDKEKDGVSAKRFGHEFNCWSINVCDEDIIMIFKTGGLIGLNLDQKVLGISIEDQENESTHIHYIWHNMKAIMKAVLQSSEENLPPKENVTDFLCLGTDFDGYNDPVYKYASTIDFADLRKDLVDAISKDPEKDKLLFGLTAEELTEKICFTNALDFVLKNFK